MARKPPLSTRSGGSLNRGRFILKGAFPDLMRECFVNATFACVRVDRGPDSLPRLAVLGQQMPITRGPLHCSRRRPVQRNVILAPSAMRDLDCTLAATFETHQWMFSPGGAGNFQNLAI